MTLSTVDGAPPRAAPAEYMVAVLDVLGFREELRKPNGLAKVQGWHEELRHHAEISATSLHASPAGAVRVSTRFLSISDGVYLWSDTTAGRADAFLISTAAFVASAARSRIPLRGAIAAGECVIDPRSLTFLGQALVDAIEAEKCQEWLGVAVLPSALRVVGQNDRVVSFDVPTKRKPAAAWWKRWLGRTEPGPRYRHALAWHQEVLQSEALAALAELERSAPTSARRKYENARRFVTAHPLD